MLVSSSNPFHPCVLHRAWKFGIRFGCTMEFALLTWSLACAVDDLDPQYEASFRRETDQRCEECGHGRAYYRTAQVNIFAKPKGTLMMVQKHPFMKVFTTFSQPSNPCKAAVVETGIHICIRCQGYGNSA